MKRTLIIPTLALMLAATPTIVMAHGEASENTAKGDASGPDWSSENTYWRTHYAKRPYYSKTHRYSTYEPAYRYGVDVYGRNPGKRYEDLDQSELSSGWGDARGNSQLSWDDAQAATRDAYMRMYNRNDASTNNNNASVNSKNPK